MIDNWYAYCVIDIISSNLFYTKFTIIDSKMNEDTNSDSPFKTAQKSITNPSNSNLQTPHTIYLGNSAVKKIRVVPITMKALI